jgi:hypothetical protein
MDVEVVPAPGLLALTCTIVLRATAALFVSPRVNSLDSDGVRLYNVGPGLSGSLRATRLEGGGGIRAEGAAL